MPAGRSRSCTTARPGLVVAPDAAELARACAYLARARRRGEGVGPRRAGDRRARHLGRLRRRPPLVKVAYYSPLPPSRSGIADYSALLLPALRERVEVVVAEPGKRAPAADVALYHIGNDPDAHGWILDALRERPGVVVLHEYVLHHLIAGITIGRGDGRGVPRRDGARARRRRAAARARRARQPPAAPLGDPAGAVPALGRRARPRARADRALPLRRRPRAAAGLRRAALADPASRLAAGRGRARRPMSRASR